MLSVRQLSNNIDSAHKREEKNQADLQKNIASYFHYVQLPDSIWKAAAILPAYRIPDSLNAALAISAGTVLDRLKSTVENGMEELKLTRSDTRFSKIEMHRKFSFSLACIILFFIGAPLGSIIRKGGMGMPLVVAIIFFLIFHLLNMFGEKFVKEGLMAPETGMWLSIIVLTPVGCFLTYKAMHDSQLFNKEFYYRLFSKLKKVRSKDKQEPITV